MDEGGSVLVVLGDPAAAPGTRGHFGPHPGLEVEISKQSSEIVRASYVR